jgi:hypothetical protein
MEDMFPDDTLFEPARTRAKAAKTTGYRAKSAEDYVCMSEVCIAEAVRHRLTVVHVSFRARARGL